MNVGLVAHDGKKNLMQNLCIAYQDILKKHKLYATSTTGQMIATENFIGSIFPSSYDDWC